jgi:hypothetical protein
MLLKLYLAQGGSKSARASWASAATGFTAGFGLAIATGILRRRRSAMGRGRRPRRSWTPTKPSSRHGWPRTPSCRPCVCSRRFWRPCTRPEQFRLRPQLSYDADLHQRSAARGSNVGFSPQPRISQHAVEPAACVTPHRTTGDSLGAMDVAGPRREGAKIGNHVACTHVGSSPTDHSRSGERVRLASISGTSSGVSQRSRRTGSTMWTPSGPGELQPRSGLRLPVS